MTLPDYTGLTLEEKELLRQRSVLRPPLRFPDFTKPWVTDRVKNVFDKITIGKRILMAQTKSEPDEEYCHPVYSAQTANYGIAGYYNHYLYENVLGWTVAGYAGRVKFITGKFYPIDTCGILISNSGFCNNCMVEAINKVTHLYVHVSLHKAYLRLNTKQMGNVLFSFPEELEEQQKISKLFEDVDKQIIALEERIRLYEKIKLGLFQRLIPKYIYKGVHKRLPIMRFKGFTHQWTWHRLSDLVEVVSGGTPSTKVKEYFGGDINWFTPAEVGDRTYVYSSERKLTEAGYKACSSAKMMPVGTVLFSSRATIGNAAILATEASTNQGFQSFIPKEDKVSTYYIYTLIPMITEQALRECKGTTFNSVTKTQVKNFVVPLTTPEEQAKITELTSKVDRMLDLLKDQLDLTRTLRKGLVQQMLC
ncbi:hypothetical protein CKF54_04160 [Psittacicella hinzii]|uniref:Type I restriction modification DNA specificity domain-containing protein n=1 Tax=Psittacicella hinzii TaxID=2028575 RepID=A0A3A1Y9N4_9GAMM|nr:restriction endonuclease subunit S [Psittacicella hinzii]RIY32827.1 hypothetical protein CKF54_04160 [Psittacicella hinzii]